MHRRRVPLDAKGLATLRDEWPVLSGAPEATQFIASDDAGCPLAVAAVVIDDEVCLLRLAVASSYDARWALHHHLVVTLIDRGVKYLVSAGNGPFGALGLSPDVHYYQQLLGYELCHIIPRAPNRAVARRDKVGLE